MFCIDVCFNVYTSGSEKYHDKYMYIDGFLACNHHLIDNTISIARFMIRQAKHFLSVANFRNLMHTKDAGKITCLYFWWILANFLKI